MSPKPSRPTQVEREELARLLPVPAERDLPGGRHQLLKDHLMREIQHTIPEPSLSTARQLRAKRKQRKRLAWRLGLPAAVLAAAGATVAAAVINTDPGPAASPTLVACAHELGRDVGTFTVDIQDGETPEQACVNRSKELASEFKDRPQREESNGPHTDKNAPRSGKIAPYVHKYLVSCTSPTGDLGVTVYPRPENMTDEQACRSVGQVRPDDSPVYAGATAAQVRRLQHLIDTSLGAEGRTGPGDGCAPYTTTRTAVQAGLDQLGMDRWRIDDQRSSPSDTADVWYYIEESAGTVVLNSGDDVGHCTTLPAAQPTGATQ
ncbi:hypothetical protein ACFYW6_39145 [Streptomyces sp. NPDC002659]|uniref:hypothetical protein n=1 Tax=Streptomyces sp. NPDC002659 TaxID=3364656 RepID=UPI00368BB3D3